MQIYLQKQVQITDGGALLYQVKWCLYTKFSDIYKVYEKHLYSKFEYCYVVFDGTETVPPQKICNITFPQHYLHIRYKICKISKRAFV